MRACAVLVAGLTGCFSPTPGTPEARTGTYGVSTQFVDARFDYLILYEPVP